MTIDKNTKVTIGAAAAVVSAFAFYAVQFAKLEAAVRQAWTLEDQQNWADWARKNNPSIVVPNPYEIRRMRRGENAVPVFNSKGQI